MAGGAARNDQLVQAVLHRSANKRVVRENLYCLYDQVDRRHCSSRVGVEQEVGHPLKVGQRLPAVDQSRQAVTSGLETVSPRARARM